MVFIFSKLPIDIIKKILLYDDHFTIRKGNIVSIISKKDYRYELLKFITFNIQYVEINNKRIRCRYFFHNLYNYDGRKINNSDLIDITINLCNDIIEYYVWIGKQYPKTIDCKCKQYYYIENKLEYNWIYTSFKYERI